MVVRADFHATQAAEIAFGLIGANALVHVAERVVDAARRWTVRYAPGEVRATCRDSGSETVSDSLHTAGKPTRIVLTPDAQSVGSTFDDMVYVRARVVDANGVTVPSADQRLHFAVKGAGQLIATDNGSSVDHIPFPSPDRTALNGVAVALVRGAGKGRFTVTATTEGLRAGSVDLEATR